MPLTSIAIVDCVYTPRHTRLRKGASSHPCLVAQRFFASSDCPMKDAGSGLLRLEYLILPPSLMSQDDYHVLLGVLSS